MKKPIPPVVLAIFAVIAVVGIAIAAYQSFRPVDAAAVKPDDYKYEPGELRAKMQGQTQNP
ncbi:MAG: hypothetical protein SFX74_12700 [Fimbriimonadaceae bacterium]|nr:hypothetical protein [Fimbriimonadaceae bacterium]